jgi:hypothetical protein
MTESESPGAVAAHGALKTNQLRGGSPNNVALQQASAQASVETDVASASTTAEEFVRRQLTLYERRCWLLAEQVEAGLLPFIGAVDCAYDAAIYSGLADGVGDDQIQTILARAFMRLPRKATP